LPENPHFYVYKVTSFSLLMFFHCCHC